MRRMMLFLLMIACMSGSINAQAPSGKSATTVGGYRVLRKDGSTFDVRSYSTLGPSYIFVDSGGKKSQNLIDSVERIAPLTPELAKVPHSSVNPSYYNALANVSARVTPRTMARTQARTAPPAPTYVEPPASFSDDSPGPTATGLPLDVGPRGGGYHGGDHVGKRGGVFHITSGGKKSYHPRK